MGAVRGEVFGEGGRDEFERGKRLPTGYAIPSRRNQAVVAEGRGWRLRLPCGASGVDFLLLQNAQGLPSHKGLSDHKLKYRKYLSFEGHNECGIIGFSLTSSIIDNANLIGG